jgi:hypothetical protein
LIWPIVATVGAGLTVFAIEVGILPTLAVFIGIVLFFGSILLGAHLSD